MKFKKYAKYEYSEESVDSRFTSQMLDSLLLSADSLDFYGVDSNSFCVGIGQSKIVLEAVEDPSDGYRSYFGCFRTSEVGKIFFRSPLASVKMREISHVHKINGKISRERQLSGWELVDLSDGHVWLQVGTDFSDDYYPRFVFKYNPSPRTTR
jgi:hypothetical protein